MKKRDKKFVLFLFSISLFVIIFFGLRFTGKVIEDEQIIQVIRLTAKNQTSNLTDVKISIISTENVMAIQENLSLNCSVLDYSIEPEIEIFAFKPSENTWIIASSSDTLEVNMFYTIAYDCGVLGGQYFILSEEGIESLGIEENTTQENQSSSDSEKDSETPAGGGSSGGGSSGGGGGSSTSAAIPLALKTNQIVEAKDEEEYNELKTKATETLSKISFQEGTQGEIRKSSLIFILVLIVIVLTIIIFLAISFTRRAKQ